jgi:hypothetical protein
LLEEQDLRVNQIFALLSIALLMVTLLGSVHGATAPGIEDRIRAAMVFISGQLATDSSVRGFLHATTPEQPRRMYAQDAGFVALALSAYQETHYLQEFYPDLKTAVEFVEAAQSGSGDFYEYYDLTAQTWVHSDHLYDWNAYAMIGPAYAAYVITNQIQGERTYWAGVIDKLRACVDYWVPRLQSADGSILFSLPDGSVRADIASNGALLVSLIHIAIFEYYWGERSLATKYAMWSQKIASWLYSFQEKSNSTWGFGGFYSTKSEAIQTAFENGLAMFGLNSYYKAASLLMTDFRPTIAELRQAMIDWMVGFLERMFDSWGGTQYARTVADITSYPKTTLAMASVLEAAIDVWINIGPRSYWDDSQSLYKWITGSNELSIDLQLATNIAEEGGGFYEGIGQNGTLTYSDLGLSALGLYALVRAGFVSIPGEYPVPEFPGHYANAILVLALIFAFPVIRPRNRLLPRIWRFCWPLADSSGFNWFSYIWSAR